MSGRLRVGVLVSGRGSNLQALLDASARPDYPAEVVVVLSDREAFDLALVRELTARRVGLVCTAGFMRILSVAFTRAFAGRAMNIHPSLLPAFPGLHAQRQALDHGVKIAGATVHFLDDGAVDTGPIILQSSVPVQPDDTEDTLAARILTEEHRLYPEAVRLFAEGRLTIAGRRVVVRGGR